MRAMLLYENYISDEHIHIIFWECCHIPKPVDWTEKSQPEM